LGDGVICLNLFPSREANNMNKGHTKNVPLTASWQPSWQLSALVLFQSGGRALGIISLASVPGSRCYIVGTGGEEDTHDENYVARCVDTCAHHMPPAPPSPPGTGACGDLGCHAVVGIDERLPLPRRQGRHEGGRWWCSAANRPHRDAGAAVPKASPVSQAPQSGGGRASLPPCVRPEML
jgi:hypothetical protein